MFKPTKWMQEVVFLQPGTKANGCISTTADVIRGGDALHTQQDWSVAEEGSCFLSRLSAAVMKSSSLSSLHLHLRKNSILQCEARPHKLSFIFAAARDLIGRIYTSALHIIKYIKVKCVMRI